MTAHAHPDPARYKVGQKVIAALDVDITAPVKATVLAIDFVGSLLGRPMPYYRVVVNEDAPWIEVERGDEHIVPEYHLEPRR